MTDFLTLADFRLSLQRQHDAYGPMIEDLQIERRIAAARLEVLDQVEAIQAAAGPTQPELTVHTWVNGVCEKCDLPQPGYNARVDPLVIAAGIEEGWLRRTEDDRGVRLWIAEQEAAAQ